MELDLLVIGSGPSGQKAAIQAAKLGKRVAVAERRERIGGVSIHTGTIPSKTLREAVLEVHAHRIVIASGTRPARPTSVEFDDRTVIDSDGLLKLEHHVPRSMIVVGAGVIGVEYASMFGALGTKVTVVDKRDRVLSFLDTEIGEAFQYLLRRQNVTFRLREQVAGVDLDVDARGPRVRLESGKELVAETVLYAGGRQGDTETLQLDKAGLEADSRGRIPVDKDHRTAVTHIFAVGDVAGGG